MGNRVTFAAKPLSETVERIFDFTSLLEEGDTLAAATVDVEVFSGTDADPEAMIEGLDVELDGFRVQQRYAGGVLGAVYTTTCVVGTCDGQVISLAAYLAVVEDAEE
jgi:hypothetical protein